MPTEKPDKYPASQILRASEGSVSAYAYSEVERFDKMNILELELQNISPLSIWNCQEK